MSNVSAELARHIDSLYGYATILAADSIAASHLVEKTCLAAAPELLPHTETTSKGQLFSIMRRIWQNQPRQPGFGQDPLKDCSTRAHSELRAPCGHSDFDPQHVRTALDRLPPAIREILLLKEFEGLSYREMASILECSYQVVTQRLACARSLLCELLSVPHSIQQQTVE